MNDDDDEDDNVDLKDALYMPILKSITHTHTHSLSICGFYHSDD